LVPAAGGLRLAVVRLERRRLAAVWLTALAGETPALQRRPTMLNGWNLL